MIFDVEEPKKMVMSSIRERKKCRKIPLDMAKCGFKFFCHTFFSQLIMVSCSSACGDTKYDPCTVIEINKILGRMQKHEGITGSWSDLVYLLVATAKD